MVANKADRSGGFTLIEVACAFAVLGALATIAFLGESSHLRTVGQTFQETVASQIAASRLEQRSIEGSELETGESAFEAPPELARQLHQLKTVETVRRLKPGLFEVAVEVSWKPLQSKKRGSIRLTTWVAARR